MTLLKGPLQSTDARGTIAGLLTFSNRRGRHVAGIASRPKQPRTEPQVATRIWLAWLSKQWNTISPVERATWLNSPDAAVLSPYHAYMKYNTARWLTQPGDFTYPDEFHFAPSTAYPAAEDTLTSTISTISYVPGVGTITHNFELRDVNDGWNILYHRITAGHPKPVNRNLVHAVTAIDAKIYEVIIANLPPGLTTIRWSTNTKSGKSYHYYRQTTETVL